MKAELDEIKQFHSTSVSQRAFWFVAATPTVNQVYISESMLSKGVQLLFKTATFYLIFIPGLSLLFLACHIATHLHKSFWRKGWRREEVGKSRRGGEEGTVIWALCYLPPTAFTETTMKGQRRPPAEQHGHLLSRAKHFIFNALFACCSILV